MINIQLADFHLHYVSLIFTKENIPLFLLSITSKYETLENKIYLDFTVI